MSFESVGKFDVLAAILGKKSTGTQPTHTARNDQLHSVFDTQMHMAQSVLSDDMQGYTHGNSAVGFESGLINDAGIMDALATITRLMRSSHDMPTGSYHIGLVESQPRNPVQPSPKKEVAPTFPQKEVSPTFPQKEVSPKPIEIGNLSARYESGQNGVGTIGYDRLGGTSYGKYQIASKTGTMSRFMKYLDQHAPDMSARLRNAGSANTGSKTGAMPTVWKKMAHENPRQFEKLQHDFIAHETYEPARAMILKKTGLDLDNAPHALKEVLWSTAVQHGPTGASKIFSKVIGQFAGEKNFNSKLIDGIYEKRKGQFGSSSQRVRNAVTNRFNEEKKIALSLLDNTSVSRLV